MPLRIPDWVWSAVLALAMAFRAASYTLRPPRPSATTSAIEGQLGYGTWAQILAAAATLVLLGLALRRTRCSWVPLLIGHTIGVACYTTFGLSIAWAAVAYGESWTGAAPLVIQAMLHAQRVLDLGAEHGRR